MRPSVSQLTIHCVEADAQYVLRFAGADWSETLPSVEAAIRRAGELVVEETRVMVYDATGHGVVVTTLFPLHGGLDAATWADRLLAHQPNGDTVAELKSALAREGVRGAVRYLNGLTSHRFTSLYLFDGPMLRTITFYDRENPEAEGHADIPVEASYCVFVRDAQAAFVVPDARSDERVKDHAKRETVQRYCGVPLLDRAGRMFGSICHFDFAPGRMISRDLELLESLAELLRQSFERRVPALERPS